MKCFKLLLSVVLIGLTFQMNAQFSFGVKGGSIRAWQFYNRTDLPPDGRLHVDGFHMSALAYYQFNKFISVGVEPGFVQRGAACVPGFLVFRQDTELFLDYAELPMTVALNLPIYKGFSIYGKGGYNLSMIVSGTRVITEMDIDVPPVKSKVILGPGSGLNRFDHGFYGGLGIAFKFGKNKIFFESDYYHGLRDVEVINTSKARSMQIGVGYMYSL